MKHLDKTERVYTVMGKSKLDKKRRKNFVKFWELLATLSHQEGVCIQEENSWMLVTVDWLITASSASMRAIRHTAALAAMSLGAGLIEVLTQERDRLIAVQEQIDAEQGKGTSKGKVSQLRR